MGMYLLTSKLKVVVFGLILSVSAVSGAILVFLSEIGTGDILETIMASERDAYKSHTLVWYLKYVRRPRFDGEENEGVALVHVIPFYRDDDYLHHEVVNYLMEKGASPDAHVKDGLTLLHDAILRGNVDAVRLLVRLRATRSTTGSVGGELGGLSEMQLVDRLYGSDRAKREAMTLALTGS